MRGDEPGFDKDNVKIYGLACDGSGGGGWGQTQWSAFTGSTGWQATDKNPWGTHFNLDQPRSRTPSTGTSAWSTRATCRPYAEIGGQRRDRARQADPVG